MPTLHLICGLPGSGKTTLAKRLEIELPALRLCPDEWMARLAVDGFDEKRRTAVETIQWEIAARALTLGIDVILENGFWSRQERMELRARASALGAESRLHFLDVPRDELLRRLNERNSNLPRYAFKVSEEQLNSYLSCFEPPTPDELA